MKLHSLIFLTTFITTSSAIAIATQPSIYVSSQSKANTYQPLPAKVCETLRNDAAKALKTTFSLKQTAFTNAITGEKGMGCTMTATGNGSQFVSPTNVINKLKPTFVGWKEDPRFQADGPMGTGKAFTKDKGLLLVNVEWEPAHSARCAPDRPISDCNLKPQEQLYKINIQGAMK